MKSFVEEGNVESGPILKLLPDSPPARDANGELVSDDDEAGLVVDSDLEAPELEEALPDASDDEVAGLLQGGAAFKAARVEGADEDQGDESADDSALVVDSDGEEPKEEEGQDRGMDVDEPGHEPVPDVDPWDAFADDEEPEPAASVHAPSPAAHVFADDESDDSEGNRPILAPSIPVPVPQPRPKVR